MYLMDRGYWASMESLEPIKNNSICIVNQDKIRYAKDIDEYFTHPTVLTCFDLGTTDPYKPFTPSVCKTGEMVRCVYVHISST